MKIVCDEQDSPEGPLRFLAMFPHAVQSPVEVKPAERPLHLPPLAAIAPVVEIFWRATAGNSNRVLTIGGDRHETPLAQGPARRFTLVAFVQAQAGRFALAFAAANPLDGL